MSNGGDVSRKKSKFSENVRDKIMDLIEQMQSPLALDDASPSQKLGCVGAPNVAESCFRQKLVRNDKNRE